MNIRYIGTGADDWAFGVKVRGGEYRRKSAAAIDGRLLLDCAPGTPLDSLPQVREVLYTHVHNDHFDLPTLNALAGTRPLTVYVEAHTAARMRDSVSDAVTLVGLTPGQTVETVQGYRVTPLRANHWIPAHPEEQPLHYVIEHDGARLFWGADGGWLLAETWARLRAFPPFDRMVLDGTLGDTVGDARVFSHNNLPMVRAMAEIFRTEGMLKAAGKIYLTHISRDSHYPQEELTEILSRDGLYAAYDDEEDCF